MQNIAARVDYAESYCRPLLQKTYYVEKPVCKLKSSAWSHIQVLRNIDTQIQMPNYKPQKQRNGKKKVKMSAICRTETGGHQEMINKHWAIGNVNPWQHHSTNLCCLYLYLTFALVVDGYDTHSHRKNQSTFHTKGIYETRPLTCHANAPSKQRHTSQRQVCVPSELPPMERG